MTNEEFARLTDLDRRHGLTDKETKARFLARNRFAIRIDECSSLLSEIDAWEPHGRANCDEIESLIGCLEHAVKRLRTEFEQACEDSDEDIAADAAVWAQIDAAGKVA